MDTTGPGTSMNLPKEVIAAFTELREAMYPMCVGQSWLWDFKKTHKIEHHKSVRESACFMLAIVLLDLKCCHVDENPQLDWFIGTI